MEATALPPRVTTNVSPPCSTASSTSENLRAASVAVTFLTSIRLSDLRSDLTAFEWSLTDGGGQKTDNEAPFYFDAVDLFGTLQPMEDELVERGLDLYRTAVQALHLSGAPAWVDVELSVAQLKALFALVDGGPTPIGGVASRLRIGLPAASSLVERLVDHGLVERREDRLDRRRTLAEPTDAGQALAQRLRQGSREALRSWMERMDHEDLEALVRGLAAMVAVAGADVGQRVRVALEG